jgi:hypothetical protein
MLRRIAKKAAKKAMVRHRAKKTARRLSERA